jgi:hypothetical protein
MHPRIPLFTFSSSVSSSVLSLLAVSPFMPSWGANRAKFVALGTFARMEKEAARRNAKEPLKGCILAVEPPGALDAETAEEVYIAALRGDAEAIEKALAHRPPAAPADGEEVDEVAGDGAEEAEGLPTEGTLSTTQWVMTDAAHNLVIAQAAAYGHCDALRALLRGGASVQGATPEGETALHKAAARGQCDAIGILLSHGALIDSPMRDGTTPLIEASHNGHEEAVLALLAAGADGAATDHAGRNCVHAAAEGGHSGVLRALVKEGEERTARDSEGGLGEAGIDGGERHAGRPIPRLDAVDRAGWNALHYACIGGHEETALTLAELGCTPLGPTTLGQRPLSQLHWKVGSKLERRGGAGGGADGTFDFDERPSTSHSANRADLA